MRVHAMTHGGDQAGSERGVAGISQEAIYRAMLEQSLDGLLVLEDTRFVDCNPSAERMYGATREQFKSIDPLELSPLSQPDGRTSQLVAREYIQLANQGRPQRFEWLARRLDGSVFPAEVCLSRMVDGQITRSIILVRDLSERKRAEQEAQLKNSRLQVLLDNFPGGVSLIDAAGHVVAWNQALLDILDLPPPLFAHGSPHIRQILECNVARGEFSEFGDTTQQRLQHILDLLQQQQAYTYERTRSDGTIIEISSAPVSGGGYVTTCVDVTAKRAIQQEYQRQSLLLKTILSYMPQGLSVFDKNLRLQIWNQGFLDVLEYDVASVYRGVPFADLVRIMAARGEYGEGEIEQIVGQRLAQARRFEPHQFERARPNGHTHLVQGTPIYEDGELQGFVTTYTDITALKNAELALSLANRQLEKNVAERTSELRNAQDDLIRSEKLAALGALVAGVAHELNTPIGNSLLIASTLKERTAEFAKLLGQGQLRQSYLNAYLQDAGQASAMLERGLHRAADLIRSFKQVAVDQASSQRRPFNLQQVSHDIIATLNSKLRHAGIRLTLDIVPGIEMDSYPGPLEQVIVNLIDNALLHGFEARHSGSITLAARLLQPDLVEIRCQDDGAGIAQEDLGRIFDPFFTTKLGKGGSGLGLNIVYNIVSSLLGGKISVTSQSGQGCCFILQLPRVAPAEAGEPH